MDERLSESDLVLLRSAENEQNLANNLYNFVTAHISAVYKLKPGDEVRPDGTINRGLGNGNGIADEGEIRTDQLAERRTERTD